MKTKVLLVAALLALAGCSDDTTASIPGPVTMTDEALGHYCQMNLTEHPGPKAQVHLDGIAEPLFFSQVRDAVAYQRMPEQSHAIRVVYVSDMGAPQATWETPGVDNWIPADKALYVVGSRIAGGMGAPELVPFSARQKAEAFAGEYGGAIRALQEIVDEDVLTPVEFVTDADGNFLPPETEQNQ